MRYAACALLAVKKSLPCRPHAYKYMHEDLLEYGLSATTIQVSRVQGVNDCACTVNGPMGQLTQL